MKGKVADFIRSVEDLADNDPQQAREILAQISRHDIDPIDRRALETRIANASRKLFLAAEATRSTDTKEKIAEPLNSVEHLADTDPHRAREILDGLKLDDIDPVKRLALETRITNAERRMLDTSIREMESILSEVKSKLGGGVLQVLADAKVRTETSLGLSEQTKAAADIRMKIDQSAELPEVRASLTRLGSTIGSVSDMNASNSQKAQLHGIKAEVDVLRLAVK